MKNVKREKSTNLKKIFIDKTQYFSRAIQLKRLEKYANEIDSVLTKYNKKSCDETMMIKGLRKSLAETTNRKIHQEDLEKIVREIAKKLGLNEEIVGIMGKHHDIGHTFLGHSGEWWISNIYEDEGLGTLCHNAIGARDLIYNKEVFREITEKIKAHNPNISKKKLNKIENSLWLIIDGINAHNGEKPEKEYIADLSKTREEFENEVFKCHVEQGYDRKIVPATSEACLMRLADQISYIPLDMVDGLREGLVRDKEGNVVTTLDQDYIRILTQLGITLEEIREANETQNFNIIAEKLKETFIEDVIKHSNKRKITMSKEIMTLMYDLRDLNNSKAVDNVILTEDQATYPPLIRQLINRYSNLILATNRFKLEEQTCYSEGDKKFMRFVIQLKPEDSKFHRRVINQALIESTKEELSIARDCVQKRKDYKDKQELGLDYSHKNARIRSYISYYTEKLQKGELINYSEEKQQNEIQKIIYGVKFGDSQDHLSMEERMGRSIAGQYISSLSDHEFIELLINEKLITSEQHKSLTRKYLEIPNLNSEVYHQSNWVTIADAQKKVTDIIKSDKSL